MKRPSRSATWLRWLAWGLVPGLAGFLVTNEFAARSAMPDAMHLPAFKWTATAFLSLYALGAVAIAARQTLRGWGWAILLVPACFFIGIGTYLFPIGLSDAEGTTDQASQGALLFGSALLALTLLLSRGWRQLRKRHRSATAGPN